MYTKVYRLFRLFGFEVKVDLSWLLLGFLVTWTLAGGLFPYQFPDLTPLTYWWMGLAGAVGLLFSIVFHELAHSLIARHYGLPITGITLFIFGGVAEMVDEPTTPRAEFIMAAAGPVASVVLALGLYVAYLAALGAAWPLSLTGVLFYLAYLNGILAVFNLVPAFPLDGGRMLRAALWAWKHDLYSATRVASRMGSGFGAALVAIGVLGFVTGNFVGGMWWILIGLFLRGAAAASYRQLLMREAIHGETVRRFVNTAPVVVTPDMSIDNLVNDYFYKFHHDMYPVLDHERALGYVSADEVKRLARSEWPRRHIRDVMKPLTSDVTTSPDTEAMKAMSAMSQNPIHRLLVLDRDRFVGIVTMKDLMRFLSLKIELEQHPA